MRVQFVRAGSILCAVLTIANLGCEKRDASWKASASERQVPEITTESDAGWVDLVLGITEYSLRPDGSSRIKLAGTHKSKEVGFDVVIESGWEEGHLGTDIQSQRGKVTYCRTGPESDDFLRVLDELYGTTQKPASMASTTAFTGVSLEGDPSDLRKGPVKIKLFYESGAKGDYAEFYTNIDLANHKLEFHEKDSAYREQVIRALRGDQTLSPPKRGHAEGPFI